MQPHQLAAWIELVTLADRLTGLADGELHRRHGITARDFQVLYHLAQSDDGAAVESLRVLMHEPIDATTARVNRLATAGVLAKRVETDDGRVPWVSLTESGRRLLSDATTGHVDRAQRWVIAPLADADVHALQRIAATLNRHLRDLELD